MLDISNIWPDWEVEEIIAMGTFCRVFRARRKEGNSIFYGALKAIRIPMSEEDIDGLITQGYNRTSVREFLQGRVNLICNDLRTMTRFENPPNVVGIKAFKEIIHKDSLGWTILILTDFLQPLTKYMREHGDLDLEETVRLGKDICKALEYCEQKCLFHGDIKPDNVFRTEDGTFKLGDWGITRRLELTGPGSVRGGTMDYMAPEIRRGERYNKSTDIYSLGIMMYQLLNRQKLPEFQNSVQSGSRYKDFCPPVYAPRELGRIILKACHPNPEKRYTNARSFRRALQLFELEHELMEMAWSTKKARKKTTFIAAAVAAVIFGGFVGATVALPGQQSDKPAASTRSVERSVGQIEETPAADTEIHAEREREKLFMYGEVLLDSDTMIEGDYQMIRFDTGNQVFRWSENLHFTSSDESVVTVIHDSDNACCVLAAKNPGTAEIRGTVDGYAGRILVRVAEAETESKFSLEPSSEVVTLVGDTEVDEKLTILGGRLPEGCKLKEYAYPSLDSSTKCDLVEWDKQGIELIFSRCGDSVGGYYTFILVDEASPAEVIAYAKVFVEMQ